MKLVTSNLNKIEEFKEILGDKIEIVKGEDIREVMGNYREVILYKTLDAGEGFIVEDTILKVDGEEWVDIKYKLDKLKNYIGKKIVWITSIGYNSGWDIYISTGKTEGVISEKRGKGGFAFDSEFIPNGQTLTLAELGALNKKHKYSARRKALEKFEKQDYNEVYEVYDIDPWDGEYQGD